MMTPPLVPAPITYGCLHWAFAAASVRARSLGFWKDASPHLPTISSARIVAGISGIGADSGAGDGDDDEKEGRLMLLHAARKIASTEAIPRLVAARAPDEPIIFSPKQICGRTRPAAKRKSPAVATTSCEIRRRADMVSQSILYEPHQRLNLPFAFHDRREAMPPVSATV